MAEITGYLFRKRAIRGNHFRPDIYKIDFILLCKSFQLLVDFIDQDPAWMGRTLLAGGRPPSG
jgi:hypothetical protein